MRSHTPQVHDAAYVEFISEHPGVLTASVGQRWADAIAGGWTADSLVRHARAYRLLCDAQDLEPMPAGHWLATMADAGPEPGLPCESAAFSAAVRALRAGRGISQAELAAMAGLTPQTISSIETDKGEHSVRWSTIADIAVSFEMSLGDLLDVGYTVLGR